MLLSTTAYLLSKALVWLLKWKMIKLKELMTEETGSLLASLLLKVLSGIVHGVVSVFAGVCTASLALFTSLRYEPAVEAFILENDPETHEFIRAMIIGPSVLIGAFFLSMIVGCVACCFSPEAAPYIALGVAGVLMTLPALAILGISFWGIVMHVKSLQSSGADLAAAAEFQVARADNASAIIEEYAGEQYARLASPWSRIARPAMQSMLLWPIDELPPLHVPLGEYTLLLWLMLIFNLLHFGLPVVRLVRWAQMKILAALCSLCACSGDSPRLLTGGVTQGGVEFNGGGVVTESI